jgi:hypothetical protein
MTLPNGGQIAASDINYELRGWYYYQMGMFEARNGYYGAINDASGPRPGGPGRNTNSGYAYSDWWGYQHNASYSPIYLYIIENSADADVRVRRYWFNGDWVGEWWAWATDWGDSRGNGVYTYARVGDQCNAWFDANVDWGNGWANCYKNVYSNYRGYLGYYYEPQFVGRQINWTTISGETISVDNSCY